jgi:hypothetical protein
MRSSHRRGTCRFSLNGCKSAPDQYSTGVGHLNHNLTAGGLSLRLWPRAAEPPVQVTKRNHMIKPVLFEGAVGSWRTGA